MAVPCCLSLERVQYPDTTPGTSFTRGTTAVARRVLASIEPALCAEPSPGLYDPTLEPASGPAGATFAVSGQVPTVDEAGDYLGPSGSIGVWWNADPGAWEGLLEGGRLDALLAG